MYWSPNFLAVVFKKQEISQQVVTRMRDLASEFSQIFRGWYFRTLTAGGATPSRNQHPARPLGAPIHVIRDWSHITNRILVAVIGFQGQRSNVKVMCVQMCVNVITAKAAYISTRLFFIVTEWDCFSCDDRWGEFACTLSPKRLTCQKVAIRPSIFDNVWDLKLRDFQLLFASSVIICRLWLCLCVNKIGNIFAHDSRATCFLRKTGWL